MAKPKNGAATDPTSQPSAGMTAAEAASLVRRVVPKLGEDGKPTGETEEVRVGVDEVFAFRDHGDHVVVVTVDGQKLTAAKK